MPRPSQKKTTPAVLRSLIGLRDTEMAALLGCSVNTIWSVESGRLKLSEQLAKKMSHQTGVSMEWLLNGDPLARPFTTRSGPRPWREFTRQEFESHVALMKAVDHTPKSTFSYDFITLAAKLRRILHTANQAHNYHLARWKITRALDELARALDAPPAEDLVPDAAASSAVCAKKRTRPYANASGKCTSATPPKSPAPTCPRTSPTSSSATLTASSRNSPRIHIHRIQDSVVLI